VPPILQKLILALVLIVFLPLILLYLLTYLIIWLLFNLIIWALWIPQGKDTLFVFSESPIWAEYVRENLLPRIEERSFVLNWSERRRWNYWTSLPAVAHAFFGGTREHNPIAIVFKPLQKPRIFRFYKPFHDLKHGKAEPLHNLEKKLFETLDIGGPERDV